MAQQEEVGSEHERVSSITSKIRWDIKLSLFCGPLTVGAIMFMLILLCCSLGIAGLIGAIDTVICGIVISVMSIPISLLETVLVAICLSAHHRWKILEDQIVKAQSRLKRNGSNRQQQSDNTNSHTHHNFMDNIVTDVENLGIDEMLEDVDTNTDIFARFQVLRFLCCSWNAFGTVCGFLLFNASFNMIYWGLAITVLEFNPPVWYVYMLVDLMVGVASPASFCISIFILADILKKESPLEIKFKALIPAFLTFVAYVEADEGGKKSKHPYWNIVGHFHLFIYPEAQLVSKDSIRMKIMNRASWYLMGMVFVTFCLSVTYIVDQLLTGEQFVFSCSEVKGDDFYCFEHSSNRYVNCSIDNSTRIDLDCFRFNRVGVQSDPIGTIITAMFLYLACEKFLMITFKFMRELHKLYPGSIWGIGLTGFGVLLLALSCSCTIVFDRVHSVYFDFQKLLQLFIISTDIFLSGLLILTVEHVQSANMIEEVEKAPTLNEGREEEGELHNSQGHTSIEV